MRWAIRASSPRWARSTYRSLRPVCRRLPRSPRWRRRANDGANRCGGRGANPGRWSARRAGVRIPVFAKRRICGCRWQNVRQNSWTRLPTTESCCAPYGSDGVRDHRRARGERRLPGLRGGVESQPVGATQGAAGKGDQPLKRRRIVRHVDRVVEPDLGARVRADRAFGDGKYVFGHRVRNSTRRPCRCRVIPCVDQEFKRGSRPSWWSASFGPNGMEPPSPRACHASGAGRAAALICSSSEAVLSRIGIAAPAASPIRVIDRSRWSLSAATSNSLHGVCFLVRSEDPSP